MSLTMTTIPGCLAIRRGWVLERSIEILLPRALPDGYSAWVSQTQIKPVTGGMKSMISTDNFEEDLPILRGGRPWHSESDEPDNL